MRPFSDAGPYFRPGAGGGTVMAELEGQRVQAKRDLRLEVRRGADAVAALPLLARRLAPGRLHSARVIAALLVAFYVAFAPIGIDNYLYLPAVVTLIVVLVMSNRERWREIRTRGGADR